MTFTDAGDTFSNSASIYFDYNLPVETNNHVTTIQTLGVNDTYLNPEVSAYPNPVKDILSFITKENIHRIEVFNITGRIINSIPVIETGLI